MNDRQHLPAVVYECRTLVDWSNTWTDLAVKLPSLKVGAV